MINQNTILVFDFETGGLDIPTLEPVQIAAVALDPHSLQVKDTFNSLMKPLDFNNLQAKAMEVNKKTVEELRMAPEQKLVWEAFAKFVKKQQKKGGPLGAPIAAGKGIRCFDIPIANRLCQTYGMTDKSGNPNLFHKRTQLDLEDIIWLWFESSDELPNHKMDTLRPYFGLSTDGAHDALVDVMQTAELIRRFLKLHRTLKSRKKTDGSPLIRFENSCLTT